MGRVAIICLAVLLGLCPGDRLSAQAPEAAEGEGEQEQEPAAEQEPAQPERRVRRLGDVESEEYELDLAVPASPTAPAQEAASPVLSLGDPALEARLRDALAVLARSQGNRAALNEVEAVLDEVLRRAEQAMVDGDFGQAQSLLNAVRQVEPNKAGLSEAWARMAELQQPEVPAVRPSEPRVERPQKLGTVNSGYTYDLPNPAQAERLDQLLAMLAARPGSQGALQELGALLDDLLAQARVAMADGDFDTAAELMGVVRSVNPRKSGLNETLRLYQQTQEIDDWLEAAREAERQGALVEPRLASAYYWYRRVLAVDLDNEEALRGLRDIQQVMVVYALDAARAYDFELSDAWLEEASTIIADQEAVNEGRRQIEAFRGQTARRIEEEILAAIRAGDQNLAEFKLIDLIALGGYEQRVNELREIITREASYGAFQPGEVIQDPFTDGSGYAPAVVVVTSGSFLMGSPSDERERADAEGPQRRVSFERGFGLGRQEVTVGQYESFVRSTGYRTLAEREGQSSVWDESMGQLADRRGINWRHDYKGEVASPDLPVLHLAWEDTQAYLAWLSERTGKSYRLPSEAEFEYALRAGSRSPYWWGDGRPGDGIENLAGQDDQSDTGRRFGNFVRGYGDGHFGPAPAGRFQPNPWGLYDMAGNVSEWTQDCWHSSYVRAPANGLPWENPGCDRRVVRGGYWASAPRQARSAARVSAPEGLRTPQIGFRVARDLW